VAKANYKHKLIDVHMKIEICSATIIFFPPFLLLFLVDVVISFLSFSLTGIALLSSATVHSKEKKRRRITLRLSQATAVVVVVAVSYNGKQVVTCAFIQSSSTFSLIDID
jgi:hypothetical protein